jgi:outer membrane autotransporter protein
MSEATLREHEHDVERARAKLAGDLAILRSPSTFSAFKEDIKQEALDAKNALVKNAKSTAQSAVNELLEDLKAKAAANPAATLAIGAGIAWRLIHRPPISTTLIGAGLFSLWRTPAQRPTNGVEPDHFLRGKERLKEQASELAAVTKEAAADVGITAKATELANAAKETVQQRGDSVSEASGQAGSSLKAALVGDEAGRTMRAFSDHARIASSSSASGQSDQLIQEVALGIQDASAQESRDKLLLGLAGVAVAAALGMAYRNRVAERGEFN